MDEKVKASIDRMTAMVIGELAEDLHENEDVLFSKFLHSLTGKMLYNDDCKLWWCGPSDVARMYREEVK